MELRSNVTWLEHAFGYLGGESTHNFYYAGEMCAPVWMGKRTTLSDANATACRFALVESTANASRRKNRGRLRQMIGHEQVIIFLVFD